MNRKIRVYIVTIFLIIFTSGCNDLKAGLGFEKSSPNEFLIEKREPIILPPDYKILPPDTKSEINNSISKDSLKSILEKKTNTKPSQAFTDNKSTNVESEILKQIK